MSPGKKREATDPRSRSKRPTVADVEQSQRAEVVATAA